MSEPEKNEPISEIGVIARAESARRKNIAIGVVLVALLAAGLIALIATGDTGPKVDRVQLAEDVVMESNDPQCRALIEDVTALGERYKSEHAATLEDVLHADPDRVKLVRQRISALRKEADTLRIASIAANVTTQESREALPSWFKLVDTELRLLDLRAERHLERLDVESRGETYVEPKSAPKQKGKIIGQVEQPERSPQEKRDAAILSLHDAFANFRIWHSGTTHPCGPADPGESPWEPKKS